jgi:hypothetical protein
MPIIPATQETKIKKIVIQDQPEKKVSETLLPSQPISHAP